MAGLEPATTALSELVFFAGSNFHKLRFLRALPTELHQPLNLNLLLTSFAQRYHNHPSYQHHTLLNRLKRLSLLVIHRTLFFVIVTISCVGSDIVFFHNYILLKNKKAMEGIEPSSCACSRFDLLDATWPRCVFSFAHVLPLYDIAYNFN